MLRSVALVSAGTLSSRITGFVRDAMIAALLGAGAVADAFLIAFQLVTLIRRLLTEGALNAALVPAWLRVRTTQGDAAAAAFAGRALGTIGFLVALIALFLAITAPFVIALAAPGFVGQDTLATATTNARLMLPYLTFAGPVAVIIALANAQRRFALSSASPLLFNVALIAVMGALLLSAADPSRAAWIIAATVGVAGLLQLALLAGARHGASPLRVSMGADMRALLGRAGPGMIASAGPQMLIVAGAIVASRAPSGVSWLYFASRLIDLPLGIISSISGAVFVTEAAHAHGQDARTSLRAQAHSVGLAMALALPAAVGLFVLAEPTVHAVFTRGAFTAGDGAATAQTLRMLALGLPVLALTKALAPSFYARGDTITPMVATLAGLAVALPCANALDTIAGIAAAISAGGAVTACILLLRSGRFFMEDARLIPIALAAVAMGVALHFSYLAVSLEARGFALAWRLAVVICAGVAIDLAGLFLFGALRPPEIRAAWRQRGLRA